MNKSIRNKNCIEKMNKKALLVNAFSFFLVMLFFGVTPKIDDYHISFVLYGGVTGEYCPVLLYSNIILGKIMVLLLKTFPNISWYYVLQLVLIFISLYILLSIFWQNYKDRNYHLALVFVFFILSYELYSRITFTKTAAVLICSGYTLIVKLINDERNSAWGYIIGSFLVTIGMLYRSSVFLMCSLVYVSSYVIYLFLNKKNTPKVLKGTFMFASCFVCLMLIYVMVGKYDSYEMTKLKGWEEYREKNTIRASLDDYPVPKYEEYENEYSEIGVSYNDYLMWMKCYNISDHELYNEKLISKIHKIYSYKEDEKISYRIILGMKNFLNTFNYEDGMFIILIASMFCVLRSKNRKIILLTTWAILLIVYLYIYVNGRVRHHVVFGLCLGIYCIIALYSNQLDYKNKIVAEQFLMLIMMVVFFTANYSDLIANEYNWGRSNALTSYSDHVKQNYERLLELSKDKEHIYFAENIDQHNLQEAFLPLEMMEGKFYHNIFFMDHQSLWATSLEILDSYGIDKENPFKEVTQRDDILFVFTEKQKDDIKIITNYIREHYDEEAQYVLEKNENGLYIYKIHNSG